MCSVVVVVVLVVYLSTCLSASLKTKLFCETSSVVELDNIKNAAILRNFLVFLNLTTSKTKQFCETSSNFELDSIKNEAILRDVLNFTSWQHQKRSSSARLPSTMESWVQSRRPRTKCVLRFFHAICVKCCACHEKVMSGHTKCCTCHAKSS